MDFSYDTTAEAMLGRLCAPTLPLPAPRTMIVLAHPGDETIGAASLLPRLRHGTFVYVTDGAPLDLRDAHAAGCASCEAYAALRKGELRSALESVGVAERRLEFVDLHDQDAVHHLPTLARWLEILIREYRPRLVFTHPYEGGHPDHDATAFAVHTACGRIAAAADHAPFIAEFTSYHAGEDGGWVFGEFLSNATTASFSRTLTAAERTLKQRLIGCYRSQRGVLRHVRRDVERFRVAPDYDFTAPPHGGALFYERLGWGVTRDEWDHAARSGLDALAPEHELPAIREVMAVR